MEPKQLNKTTETIKNISKVAETLSDSIDKVTEAIKKLSNCKHYCINCEHCEICKSLDKNQNLKYYIYCNKSKKFIAASTKEELLENVWCKEKDA